MNLHTARDWMTVGILRIGLAKDRTGVESAIKDMERINLDLAHETGTDPADIRRVIREGVGVFGDVAEKCKTMGVV